MSWKAWEKLPDALRTPEVKPYYEALAQKKGCLLAKRAFDFVVAGVACIALSPVFLACAVAIKLDSPGPVFFRQVRVTQYGRKFRIFKFRTMVANADEIGTQVAIDHDTRITNIGSFLRKYRLDEIPQLLNILIGAMSFVGTRPEVPKYVAQYTPEMMATLLLPAGVTSFASMEYKDEAELLTQAKNVDDTYVREVLPNKMKYNLLAIHELSVWRDIKMMLRTVRAVLKS